MIVRSPRPNSPTQRLIEGILSLGTGQDIVIAPEQPLPFFCIRIYSTWSDGKTAGFEL